MLGRVGRWCHNHRVIVLIAWIVAVIGFGAVASSAGSDFAQQFKLPNVESARGREILDARFAGKGGGQLGQIVFRAPAGVQTPAVKDEMSAYFTAVGDIPQVDITSPYAPGQSRLVSTDGTTAYASVEIPDNIGFSRATDLGKEIENKAPQIDGVEIEFGGNMFSDFQPPSSELLGLAFAIFILIVAFGSVLAMGLPIGTALAGIAIGSTIVTILSHVLTMPDFTTTLAVMIGLGVGIDYALFIVTRYREGLHNGHSSEDATAIAINTAGRAVLFAGTTVVISLLGMFLMQLEFMNGIAAGAALTVLATMIASITLLPAILGFAKHRVEVTRWRGIIAAALVALGLFGLGLGLAPLIVALPLAAVVLIAGFFVPALRKEIPKRRPKPVERTLAYRWSRLIQARPWPAVVVGGVALIALAIPFFSLRMGFSDAGNGPQDQTTRRAYDMLADGFGPGSNGPLVLVTEVPAGTDQAAIAHVTDTLKATPGLKTVSAATMNTAGTAARWTVIPTTSPQDAATTSLVHHLRDDVLPQATRGTGLDVAVAGQTAVGIDFSDYLAARLPLFFAVVLGLSFLLMMVVFRSVLVPLKAVVMNLISIGAAYGVVVAVFQWGWASSLIGVGKGGPIEPFIPMMMFAIVFGLSMDYEVFLLSRIKEEWDRTGNNARAVADGLARTARVITAAAAIMVFVFGSFLLESERVIKLFGLGLAVAVLLDATVVRMLLVPATMELLGNKNWWLPRWLARILPKIDVEGTTVVPEPTPEPELVGATD
ncbi:MAG TPA: MMPL family transporter [Acidimicrobiales bacterium]|nr:MMPL family transporter [Acidimicrobiales bacterium]